MNKDALKEKMDSLGVNATKLSEMTGVSKATLSRILNGSERGCTVKVAKKIAESLKLKPKEAVSIFFGDDVAETHRTT